MGNLKSYFGRSLVARLCCVDTVGATAGSSSGAGNTVGQANRGTRYFGLIGTLVALLLVSSAGCAAYQFGNRSLYPVDIQTVYVPVFESSSFRRDLGERLTEAVVKEIELRTPYKVVGNPNADTTLTGRIAGDSKHLLFQTRNADPREMEVNLQVQVNWTDRRGNMIRQGPATPVPAACVSVTGTSEVVAEVGQSIATAQQQAIQRLARQIVSLMEAPW